MEIENIKPFKIESDIPLQSSRVPRRRRMTEINRRLLKSAAMLKPGQSFLVPDEGSRKDLQSQASMSWHS